MAISKKFQDRFVELTNEMIEKGKSKRAKIIGISNTTYSNAYNYGIIPKTPSLIKIADFFNISIEYLRVLTETPLFRGCFDRQLTKTPLFQTYQKNPTPAEVRF